MSHERNRPRHAGYRLRDRGLVVVSDDDLIVHDWSPFIAALSTWGVRAVGPFGVLLNRGDRDQPYSRGKHSDRTPFSGTCDVLKGRWIMTRVSTLQRVLMFGGHRNIAEDICISASFALRGGLRIVPAAVEELPGPHASSTSPEHMPTRDAVARSVLR